jgi:hypothetical protein
MESNGMALKNLIRLPVARRVGELYRPGTIHPNERARHRDILHALKNDICCLLLGISGLKASGRCNESLRHRLDLLEETLLEVNRRVDELAGLSKNEKPAEPGPTGKKRQLKTPEKRRQPNL